MSLPRYETVYGVHLLDDLHNFFPAILYNPSRFNSFHDMMNYFQVQMTNQFNTFNRGTRQYLQSINPNAMHSNYTTIPPLFPRTTTNYTRQTTAPQVPIVMETETYDITSLLGIPAPSTEGGNLLASLLQAIRPPGAADPFAPVIVAPTVEQISIASSLRSAVVADEQSTCAICQETYTEGQAIRRITHCGHEFHINCLTPWFERNVHCPVCRYDIREHVNPVASQSNSA